MRSMVSKVDAPLPNVARCSRPTRRKRCRPSSTSTFVIAAAAALVFSAGSMASAAHPGTAFVGSDGVTSGGFGSSRHINLQSMRGTRQTADLLHSSSSEHRSLRCRPIISSTLSPHLLHVPPPMHSTKESISFEGNRSKNKRRRRIDKTSQNNESEAACLSKAPAGPHVITRVSESAEGMGKGGSISDEDTCFENSKIPSGAYSHLSVNELQSKTTKLINKRRRAGQMKASEIHEATRLLSSWSKRAVHESGPMAESLFRLIVNEKEAGNVKANPTATIINIVSLFCTV